MARWGLALQELDLQVHYRPGKTNTNADFLSRYPGEEADHSGSSSCDETENVVALITPTVPESRDGVRTIRQRQKEDVTLRSMIDYLEDGILPADERETRLVTANEAQYVCLDGILYHTEKDKTLRLVPPSEDRRRLFQEVHSGIFGGHMRDAKVHSQLSRHYWWPGMRRDIKTWCRECLTCPSQRVGTSVRPPLVPLPVAGAFDRVGVDVMQLPTSKAGNKYAVVFVDYLTKWPEVFATRDQTALTIARLLVEQIVSRHGVPRELLSDRGAAFLSTLLREVARLMGIHKVSTTAYHPQTDGLVERFNRTLTDMLSKTVERDGRNWDERLPYVLFAYRSSIQASTKESPFFLLYGRDPQLPITEALTVPVERCHVDVQGYREELVIRMSEAWEDARIQVGKAQQQQKRQHDKGLVPVPFAVGERVFLHVPSLGQGKAYKFARQFKGPYHVMKLYENGADIRLVAKPQDSTMRVALNRLRRCPKELGTKGTEKGDGSRDDVADTASPDEQTAVASGSTDSETGNTDHSRIDGPWTGRLRRRTTIEDNVPRDGDM